MIALLLLAGCEQRPGPAPDPCQTPALAAPADAAGTPDGETERLTLCIKSAVRDLDRAGGPAEAAAKAAVVRCAPQEQAEFAAMARRERVYQWEKDEMHNRLEHVALINARQTRSRGCGRPGGAPEEP
ncbi:MAG TPA: hypothetical protein VGH03_06595 [Caulobacteraceae bacterium]